MDLTFSITNEINDMPLSTAFITATLSRSPTGVSVHALDTTNLSLVTA